MKRIFIALKVEPGEKLMSMFSSLRTLLGNEKITWVAPGNIHLTMAFLGDIEDERTMVAGIMLKQKCAGFGEFGFNLSGAGVFRNFKDPRVIWIGIDNSEKLLQLNDLIITGLKDTGFKIEERQFNPHITLGRVKSIKDAEALKSTIYRYQDTFIQEVRISEVILYESILRPIGPVYKPIGRFRFLSLSEQSLQ
jgi:2'-5' RNA ligase